MGKRRRKKCPTEFFEADIRALSHDGRGIASIEGKTTFIRGALPGEKVSFQYNEMHGSYDEGITQQVLEASADRVPAPCEYFMMCGGCSMQHLDLLKQIEHKQAVMLEQLAHFGGLKPQQVLAPLTGPSIHYRHKARLAARYVTKKEKVLVGFREVYGRFIADMDSCKVLHKDVSDLIVPLQKLIENLSIPHEIPQIEVAVGEDATALIFRHLKDFAATDLTALVEFAKIHKIHIYLQSGGPATVTQLWPEPAVNRLHYTVPEFDLEYRFHPGDFTQVNPEMNRAMLSSAVKLLELNADDTVLDLFCGLGNFSLALAKNCKKVVGVEGSSMMVERANENAAHNKITNTEFYSQDLEKPIDTAPWLSETYTKLLIDPARAGAETIMNQMNLINPERIVYVSCNPATLARDAGMLVEKHGYVLTKAGVMDMFPHTGHVESIAVFERNNG